MGENGEIESADEEAPQPPQGRRMQQYRPVESQDRAVLQMSSLESGSPPRVIPLKKITVTSQSNSEENAREGSSQADATESQRDSKLELFG